MRGVTTAMLLTILTGCTPPTAREADRLSLKPVTLDLSELRINRQATMSHVSIEAAFVDGRTLRRMFGLTNSADSQATNNTRTMSRSHDLYLVSRIRVSPDFRKRLMSFTARIVAPAQLQGRSIAYLNGSTEDLIRGDELISVQSIERRIESLRSFDSNATATERQRQIQDEPIILCIEDVNAK